MGASTTQSSARSGASDRPWLGGSGPKRGFHVKPSNVRWRERLVNLEALHQSRLMLEVDWADGRPRFPR